MIRNSYVRFLFAGLISGGLISAGNAGTQNKTEWKLVWSDEFEGDRFDQTIWSRCKRGRPDWRNTMSADPRLLELSDGVLRLKGNVNDLGTDDSSPFLAAGVTSKGNFSFQYGKVQNRARFKSAQGAWPALWMMGEQETALQSGGLSGRSQR